MLSMRDAPLPGVECVPEELEYVVNGCIELPEALVLLQAPVQHGPGALVGEHLDCEDAEGVIADPVGLRALLRLHP